MTTSKSPLRVLKTQAETIAKMLKAVERGDPWPDPTGSIAEARKNKDAIKFGIVMDDKFIKAEMTWAQIKESSEVAITEWILRCMREQRREATH